MAFAWKATEKIWTYYNIMYLISATKLRKKMRLQNIKKENDTCYHLFKTKIPHPLPNGVFLIIVIFIGCTYFLMKSR